MALVWLLPCVMYLLMFATHVVFQKKFLGVGSRLLMMYGPFTMSSKARRIGDDSSTVSWAPPRLQVLLADKRRS
jgi:hypothetical protein